MTDPTAGTERRDVAFDADGTTLRGWFYPAADRQGAPGPAVVMTHGFSLVKEVYLDRFAERFAASGLSVLLYDHRNFGASDGTPRQEIDPWRQIEDYRHALTFLSTLPEVDADRLGVWGTSYSGAHAVVVGATDLRVKAVVAQVPAMNGVETGWRRTPMAQIGDLGRAFAAERLARMSGEPARTRPVAGDPSEGPVYTAPDALEFFLNDTAVAPSYRNEVTVRSGEWSRAYNAGSYIEMVSPRPLLMIVGDDDTLSGTDLQLEAYGRAREPKELRLIPGGHFDPYVKQFEAASSAAADFLAKHLNTERLNTERLNTNR
ncbi:alpha/beta hydrolase [Streptomyces liangshanensis]|uniref:Alpha/beta hydrolase n=1 Tax=Streptomyces liangshanensis TaxID=2717324 RepID=A0A6G9GST1_9ACTN|nr:alpha/beta hydrolase [Streptomyces liangshanensis]QIQ01254.1 alpha/beta hydrolase [Streptomyces liangshanensis]